MKRRRLMDTLDVLNLSLLGKRQKKRAWVLKKIREATGVLQVSTHFVSDAKIQELNKKWRGQNKPTDVLSFSAQEGMSMPGLENILGDVVISVDRAKAQAEEFGHLLEEELVILFVHGLMHLKGYDHERGSKASKEQAQAEMLCLSQIGMDPKLALCGRS